MRAALLLIDVRTKLGKTVPTYAKRIEEGTASPSECRRVERELYTLLSQMRNSTREELLEDNRMLYVWYHLYGKRQESSDVECPMLTGNFDNAEGVENQRILLKALREQA